MKFLIGKSLQPMPFNYFIIDFKRSLKHYTALIILCFVFGFIFTSAMVFNNQLAELYKPVEWGADLLVLPKGLSPEVAQKNILNGEPTALIPEALFESLQSQVLDEQKRKNLSEPSLQMAALIPYRSSDQKIKLAVSGSSKNIFNDNNNTFLSAYEKTDLQQVQSQFSFLPAYQTPEWKDKVIFLILVKGKTEALQSLKTLVDRRTVAEAFFVNSSSASEQMIKYQKLLNIIFYLAGIFMLVLSIGLYLAFQILLENRKIIFENFNELSLPRAYRWKFIFYQICFLIIIPIIVGLLTAHQLSAVLQALI